MEKLVDNGTCMYPRWTLIEFGVKVVCGLIIPSDSQYQHLPRESPQYTTEYQAKEPSAQDALNKPHGQTLPRERVWSIDYRFVSNTPQIIGGCDRWL